MSEADNSSDETASATSDGTSVDPFADIQVRLNTSKIKLNLNIAFIVKAPPLFFPLLSFIGVFQ